MSAQLNDIATMIAGENASHHLKRLAFRIAEAQIDVIRIHDARRQIFMGQLEIGPCGKDALVKGLLDLSSICESYLRSFGRDAVVPQVVSDYADYLFNWNPSAERKLLYQFDEFSRQLLAIDRYERRAFSRRKMAIRQFDAAVKRAYHARCDKGPE